MNVALLMVSYRKDFDFAVYAMKSALKYATGFSQRVVIVPNDDVLLFYTPARQLGFEVIGFDERPGKGMLHHMAVICEADIWLPEADAVMVLDSDTMFTRPVTPDDFMQDGKPVILRERFEDFRSYSSRYSWKTCVRSAVGIDPEWETMCRFPMIHLRGTLEMTRLLIAIHTKQDWKEYILSGPNAFPQSFAEFPTLGAVAIEHFREQYHFVDYRRGEPCAIGPEVVKQFWSHGGLDMINDRHPGRKAREVMDEILAK